MSGMSEDIFSIDMDEKWDQIVEEALESLVELPIEKSPAFSSSDSSLNVERLTLDPETKRTVESTLHSTPYSINVVWTPTSKVMTREQTVETVDPQIQLYLDSKNDLEKMVQDTMEEFMWKRYPDNEDTTEVFLEEEPSDEDDFQKQYQSVVGVNIEYTKVDQIWKMTTEEKSQIIAGLGLVPRFDLFLEIYKESPELIDFHVLFLCTLDYDSIDQSTLKQFVQFASQKLHGNWNNVKQVMSLIPTYRNKYKKLIEFI